MRRVILFLLSIHLIAQLEATSTTVLDDLLIIENVNRQIALDRFPSSTNYLLTGGYFLMPSARMQEQGMFSAGYASVSPYRHWLAAVQVTPFFEVSGAYRVFSNVEDPILSPYGFGEFSDKGVNCKLAFPLDTENPISSTIAIGVDDFLGTRAFRAGYVVWTSLWKSIHLETSFGWGKGRLHGFFGGLAYFPFKHSESCARSLSIQLEYDATDYKNPQREPHPDGRRQPWKVNVGIKWLLWDSVQLTFSRIRGAAWAGAISCSYNFGESMGILPKIQDPLMAVRRPSRGDEASNYPQLQARFSEQKIDLLKVERVACGETPILLLVVANNRYLSEFCFHERLMRLLATLSLAPAERVEVYLAKDDLISHRYSVAAQQLSLYSSGTLSLYELLILSEKKSVNPRDLLVHQISNFPPTPQFEWQLYPRSEFLFGSARGKLKYVLGVGLGINGFLSNSLYYCVQFGWLPFGNIHELHSVDRLNPSQIINVRTDGLHYLKCKQPVLETAFAQKNFPICKDLYGRVAWGCFERAYGGISTQYLYIPLNQRWALGIEGALLKKRTYDGWGFTSRIRKLNGFVPTYRRFLGSQYFLTWYYHWSEIGIAARIKTGKFLANDYGVRGEISRLFRSGLRLGLWYTLTNGDDHLNGKIYYDKGIFFSLPLDFFYAHSSSKRWNYSIAAWLRDVGAIASTGRDLYEMIQSQRVDR